MARSTVAVVDLQFGSTGKGQIAGTIAHHWKADVVATAWGPNAGHTFIGPQGRKTVSRMLASSAVAPDIQHILIGPGTVLDLPQLAREIDGSSEYLHGKNLVIHPQTVILWDSDAANEKYLKRIGSTMKGTSAAMIRKIGRESSVVAGGQADIVHTALSVAINDAEMSLSISAKHYDAAIDRAQRLILEGAQGYSLGIHTHFYPYTTSRDVSTAQLFADCRVPWPTNRSAHVVGVARTYPIRVANRYDAEGNMVGTSGGYYPDQEETTWDTLGREPELTTVTKLPRRVFTFSHKQIKEAARVCSPDSIALTFCDYLGSDYEVQVKEAAAQAFGISKTTGVAVNLCSFGPSMEDIHKHYPAAIAESDRFRPLLNETSSWLHGAEIWE